MAKTNKKMHGSHEATCLCCEAFSMGYEEDLSDVTPGEGLYCRCWKGNFNEAPYEGYHSLVARAQTCDDFSALENL